jgi:hypothetical protein
MLRRATFATVARLHPVAAWTGRLELTEVHLIIPVAVIDDLPSSGGPKNGRQSKITNGSDGNLLPGIRN